MALKELLRSKLSEAREGKAAFEAKYGTSFAEFKRAWEADAIEDRHSYKVEHDYWVWEAAVTDEVRLGAMVEQPSEFYRPGS